jgi:hypothetical protein
MGLAALAHWSMTTHALRAGFVHEAHREATRPFGGVAALGFTALFLLSIPVAFASTTVAALMWAATIVLRYPLRWLAGRRP